MHHAADLSPLRRSSRVPVALPILVTGLEENPGFSEVCETLVVNAHGCAMRSTTRLEAGSTVQFQRKDGTWTMAHIVDCQPLGQDGWMVGARLEHPNNFWGLEQHPEDWPQLADVTTPGKPLLVPKRLTTKAELKAELMAMTAQFVEPLRAELAEIRERLDRRQTQHSQFEISLSYIPPEVQDKLASRLHDELGKMVLWQTRQQSDQLLEATKEAIGKRITDVRQQFSQELSQELHKIEQRAHELSEEVAGEVHQHQHAGAEEFKKQVMDANIRLERRSEELLRALRGHLSEEHEAYQRAMEKVHTAVAGEAVALHTKTAELTNRIAALDAAAHHLEEELDGRLVRVASDIISGARNQLESALDVVLKDLGTRNARELGGQLDEASAKLKAVHKGIETAVSELVKTKVADSLVSFGQTIEALAQDSVTRWRRGLAKDLESVTEILGEQYRAENAAEPRDFQEIITR